MANKVSGQKRFLNKIQLVTVDLSGQIKFSDANLFPSWKEEASIFECHPFFDIIQSLKDAVTPTENEFSFPCVHLSEEGEEEIICDINITFELAETHIIIFDYSDAYFELNKISQQRNDSAIKAQELEFSNKLLVEKEKFKNNFIANVNHELTAPLTSIKGFIDLLEKTELDYEQEELTKIIKNEASHLQGIFSDMLDVSNIESGEFKLNKEVFNLFDLIKSIEESFCIVLKEDIIDFKVTIDKKINPLIHADKTRVYQIITNLLNNAIKYSEEGEIHLSITKISGKNRKQELEIKVSDTGIGISKEDQQKIFEPFLQVNQMFKGTGLGLHITRNLVHLMEGTIAVNSEINQGTEFKVVLALRNAPKSDEELLEKSYSLPEGKKFRILIVENRQNTQYLIMKQLLAYKCFFVDVVTNGEDALRNVENRNYDLLIVDIKLKGMTGLALTKKIRNDYGDTAIKDIPIVGISGLQQSNILNIALSAGMDSFISKPFSEELLLSKIKRLLSLKKK